MGSYRLRCLEGGEITDDQYALRCAHHPGLLRAEYDAVRLNTKDYDNVFKFYDWLPVNSVIRSRSKPIVFKNDKISEKLGLKDLWIAFTGYYPKRDAFVTSCSFKEMEALPTMARLKEQKGKTIVVASAGNTGRAFAQISNETGVPSLIVVPKGSRDRIRVSEDNGHSKLMTVDGDYADAIALAERISSMPGFVAEGGARNIARRDGMGTVMLESAITIGRIPDRYFQAIGSGTGGISAWEASMRLINDSRFGERLPELHLSQNEPFTPMKKAWENGRRNISQDDMQNAEQSISKVYADVLTNRSPPYGVAGGVYDAMTACGGRMYGVTNDEAKDAEKMWMRFEDAVPDPAASVALASLIKATADGTVPKEGNILLNMTGGGHNLVSDDIDMTAIRPFAEIRKEISDADLRRLLNE
jgi:cysteate synthase